MTLSVTVPTVGIMLGSTRLCNNSSGITNWVVSHLDNSLNSLVRVQIFEPKSLICEPVSTKLPKLIKDFTQYDSLEVQRFSLDVDNCDCFIIITPVYNGTYSGQLKSLLDFLYHEYTNKPVLNIVHGGKDTELAVEELLKLEKRLNLIPSYNLPIHDPKEYLTGEKTYDCSAASIDPLLSIYTDELVNGLYKMVSLIDEMKKADKPAVILPI